jgi:hypothetical protein
MVVAYIAYKNLTAETRSQVDALLKLNQKYNEWTDGVPRRQKALAAFLRAATWADCIKMQSCAPGYTSDGDQPPGNPTDTRNIGYEDKLMHKYWHYVDQPIAAGAPGEPAKEPNALTQIVLLSGAIHSDESREIKSYDLVWLEHLVGDVHQPLHCTSRFTRNHPHGDAGGNLLRFCEKPCNDKLHLYWDALLGDKLAIDEVARIGDELIAGPRPPGTDDLTPSDWIDAGFSLAKSNVYVPPISSDNDPGQRLSPRPDAEYSAAALKLARAQVTLAGYRLAALLNANLKQ